ncbi:MAG: DUF3566 domain-containing protein [Actinomycetia bacterium]|nr:DUF3566 domain-containing protein [Actinomycetes bacterium]MCH9708654.1 DUF3566 domain-containing protein [Actinomycetes bacterium]MCH9769232.1 DUF3566 domain-containing protein [Actinomycetes bacterium]
MSSPIEPGPSRAGETSGADSGSAAVPEGAGPKEGALGNSVTRSGPPPVAAPPARGAAQGDAPPWQRGPADRARAKQQPPEAPPAAEGPPGAPSGLDARLNRFIAGAPATADAREADSAGPGERADRGARSEESSADYGSELPNLSDAPPRPQQKNRPVERPVVEKPAKAPEQAQTSGGAVQVAVRPAKGPVRASMQIRHVDPWSALKVSLVLSVAMFFVWMIAVAFLYLVLGGMGVWSKLNSNVGDLLTSASGSTGGELVSSGTIFGGAALIGLVNIVLMTAAATVGVFIYNLTTDLVGGVEVTLADRD